VTGWNDDLLDVLSGFVKLDICSEYWIKFTRDEKFSIHTLFFNALAIHVKHVIYLLIWEKCCNFDG